jgi:hypothetical protein
MNNLCFFNLGVRFDSPRRHHLILDDRIAQTAPNRRAANRFACADY